MVQKRSPGRPRTFDAQDALDKAVAVFWENGYEAADMATLCKRMGLSKPSLYNAFGSKDALFVRALERYRATITRQNLDALHDAETPALALRAYFESVARNVSGQNGPCGCLIACVAVPAASRMPAVAEFLDTGAPAGLMRAVSYLQQQVQSAALPAEYDIPAAIALMADLSMALGLKGRLGVPFETLQPRAARFAELTLAEGMPHLH